MTYKNGDKYDGLWMNDKKQSSDNTPEKEEPAVDKKPDVDSSDDDSDVASSDDEVDESD